MANFELLNYDLNKTQFVGNDEDEVYFREKLSEIAYSSFFNFNSSRSSLMNIPRDQYKALLNLPMNKDIVIMCPDKGSGVVIMNRAGYVKKVEDILQDTSKFKAYKDEDLYNVSRRVERKVCKFLLDHLKKPGHISDEHYKRLYPNGTHIGVLYGLPKVHKDGVPMRPICSAIGTSTYELGKYVSSIIRPAASSSLGTDLNSTFQFVNQIR